MNFDSDQGATPTAWAWRVTDSEIRAAKRDWLNARDNGGDAQQIAFLFEYFRMLLSVQAQQIADEFRTQHTA